VTTENPYTCGGSIVFTGNFSHYYTRIKSMLDKSYWIEVYDAAIDAGVDEYTASVQADHAARERAMDEADAADLLEDR
jgi:hypothetical protein